MVKFIKNRKLKTVTQNAAVNIAVVTLNFRPVRRDTLDLEAQWNAAMESGGIY